MRLWGKKGRASGGCSTGGTAKRLGREQAGGAPRRGRQVWLFRETGVLRRRLAVSQWRAACDRKDRRSSVRLCEAAFYQTPPRTGKRNFPLAGERGGVWRMGRASSGTERRKAAPWTIPAGGAESYGCSQFRGGCGGAGRRSPASSGRSARPAGLADGVPSLRFLKTGDRIPGGNFCHLIAILQIRCTFPEALKGAHKCYF